MRVSWGETESMLRGCTVEKENEGEYVLRERERKKERKRERKSVECVQFSDNLFSLCFVF